MGRQTEFSDGQNERVRVMVGRVMHDYRGNASAAAAAIGVSRQALAMFLAGECGAGMQLVRGIAKALDMPISEVLFEAKRTGEPIAEESAPHKDRYLPFNEWLMKSGIGVNLAAKDRAIHAHDDLELADRICEDVFGAGRYSNADVIAAFAQIHQRAVPLGKEA